MPEQTKIPLAGLILAGLLAGCAVHTGEKGDKPETTTQSVSLAGEPSRLVKAGTTVTLALEDKTLGQIKTRAKKAGSDLRLTFQWQRNGQNIPGATNSTYTIANADFSHVASYILLLSGPVEEQSAPIHLSVYSLFDSRSNGGIRSNPITAFTAGNITVCGTTYDRYKVYFPFDGPNASSPSANFPNTSNSTNLDVTTCTNVNGQVDTGVQIKENWVPFNQKCCNDDSSCEPSNSKLSSCTTVGLLSNKTYRVAIVYKNSTLGTNTTITFNWYYHN